MPLFHVQYRNQRTFSNRCGDKLIQHSALTASANSETPCFTCKSRCASHPKMLHAVLVVHLHLWFRFFYHEALTSDRPESARLAATGIEARNGPAMVTVRRTHRGSGAISRTLLSTRAGVPVCSRPSLEPARASDPESPVDGSSPIRQAGKQFIPGKAVLRKSKRAKIASTAKYTDMNFSREKGTCAYDDFRARYNFARFCV
jgi:hypothetical protein